MIPTCSVDFRLDCTDGRSDNNLLTIPLTSNFQTGSPTIKGLPQPSGPPAVANGFLWHSLTSLFLYGGLFSDSPDQVPSPFSLWEYDLTSSSWKEHKDPKTSAGNNSEPAGRPIERAAEGAGLSIPELGRGWYFGGHLDFYTTPGWSKGVPRQYLKSFIEYTFPGAQNDGVEELEGGKPAGSDGAWRNITQGGLQSEAGFTRRADGVLVYIPGYGREGIILNLAGGTNASFVRGLFCCSISLDLSADARLYRRSSTSLMFSTLRRRAGTSKRQVARHRPSGSIHAPSSLQPPTVAPTMSTCTAARTSFRTASRSSTTTCGSSPFRASPGFPSTRRGSRIRRHAPATPATCGTAKWWLWAAT